MRNEWSKRNLLRPKESTVTTSTATFVLVTSILSLAWLLCVSTSNVPSTNSAAATWFPVVAALPNSVTSSPLSSTIERAVRRKTKGKIEKSLRKTSKKDSGLPESNEQKNSLPDKNGGGSGSGSVIGDTKNNVDFSSIQNRIKIESFLAPRKFPLRTFLRTLCLLLATWSFFQCWRTSGIPYAQTVWNIVYGTGTGGNDAATAAKDFAPTLMEKKLAEMILSCTNDFNIMLPPVMLPMAGPLLKFLASTVAFIALTMLLPHWSTKFRVLLDYRRVKLPSNYEDDSQQSSGFVCHDLKKEDMSVLVRLGTSSSDNDGHIKSKNLIVIPLQQSSKSSTTKAKKEGQQEKNKSRRNKKLHQKEKENIYDTENTNYVHPSDFYFEVNHSRIYCHLDSKQCIDGAPTVHATTIAALKRLVDEGGLTKKRRKIAKERYEPYNTFSLATPTFREAFIERISSPLVVIQLVGGVISMLEQGLNAAISMCIILSQHYYNAKQAIISATQLAQEVKTNLQDDSGYQVSLWKESKQRWVSITAGQLVPGDIFRLTMNQQQEDDDYHSRKRRELIVPVDALIVKGQCLTNEAILTGESVPQIKIPLEFEEEKGTESESKSPREHEGYDGITSERRLDLHRDRSSIVFAGTTLFHTLGGDSSVENADKKYATAGGVTCIALRTGAYSSKGRLLKALKGSAHVGAISNKQSEKDATRMIASLSCCAALSCLSLFVRGNANAATVSPFRRVIQCTRIALASIPSDLPLALASIARKCSKILRHQSDVVCSEPGSLLTAAYIDTVVFDKTGTLTADTQSLAKVVGMSSQPEYTANEAFQTFVLAGCHSLVYFEEDGKTSVVGDPLDQAAIQFSGWKYNQTANFFFLPESDAYPLTDSEPIRLWQIRNFPFDPSRRLSSAIVLLQRKDSSFELWKLIKGSPDTIEHLIKKDSNDFKSEFRAETQELEMQGYRCIALGAENLANSSITQALFPNGLIASTDNLERAREIGKTLHRNKVDRYDPGTVEPGLNFCGFCCFDASTRPSSKRVIKELIRGDLTCIMLTGDSIDAALSVARKVEIFKHRKIAVLERVENCASGKETLVWKTLHTRVRKDGSFRILHRRTKIVEATVSSIKKIIKDYKRGRLSLATNGRALEIIFSGQPGEAGRLITKNLATMSVIARATPEVKKKVIETLKQDSKKRVMMCGDGVNDVAAIQSADVAASLLTGFGAEKSESEFDIDDKRRMKRLSTMNIGSNRFDNIKKASSKQEANDRIRKEIEKCRQEIEKGASPNCTESSEIRYTFEDMKEMISATMRAAKNERQRVEQLRKGGGDAARILAEERQQQISTEKEVDNDDFSPPPIKPGEASLVSSFSCLHPSVDGIDAILREGIATAASALATQQAIGLHSLMSCFHLATLYRDGLQYGKHMWNIEVMLYSMLESARSKASCTPRPRLPNSIYDRPLTSLFQLESIFGIVSQAIVHISCMALSVKYAKHLESDARDSVGDKRVRLDQFIASKSSKLEKLLDTLSKRSLIDVPEGETTSNPFFQRPPFRPNYKTNCVFIFSILQSALSALVSHKGAPFYRSVLESRDLCAVSGITFIFVIICITGKMSLISNFLQVKALPSVRDKLILLGIVVINIIACVGCRLVMDNFFPTSKSIDHITMASDKEIQSKTAADHEMKLLSEEMEYNLKGLRIFYAAIIYFIIDLIL